MIKLEDIISKRMKYAIMKVAWPVIETTQRWFHSNEIRKISQRDWIFISTNLKAGDVILSTRANNLGNFILPGKAKHAAMVISAHPRNPVLMEAVSKGVGRIPLYDFMADKEFLYHFRPRSFSQRVIDSAVDIAKGMEGLKYDHDWSPDNAWIYCSELIYASYSKAYNMFHPSYSFPLKMKSRCGELTYIPDDIRLDPENWIELWSTIK